MKRGAALPAEPATDRYAELSSAEQLLVWGLRAWVACTQGGHDPEPCLREGFARFGVGQAAASLDALLRLTARTAVRRIDVGCVRCPGLSPDEALLLVAVAALQRGDQATAGAALAGWLPLEAADLAVGTADGLVTLLELAGWVLPRRGGGHPWPEDRARPGEAARALVPACTLH